MFNPNLNSIIISFNEETVEEDLEKIKVIYDGYISKLKYKAKGGVEERVYQLDSIYINFDLVTIDNYESFYNMSKDSCMVGFIVKSTVVVYGRLGDRFPKYNHVMNIKAVNPDEEVKEDYLECCESKLKWTIG